MRREGEEGGLGTVLVLNSLLYATTPVKDMGNGYLLITFPETENTLVSYLIKPLNEKQFDSLKQGIEDIVKSIKAYSVLCEETVHRLNRLQYR